MEERAQAIRDIEARLAQLTPQLAGVRAELEQTLLRAPVDGAVVGLQVNTVGGVLHAGEAAMQIVPEGQQLIVEAQIPPEEAENLREGLTGEVRITAFTGRSVPRLQGRVQRVSADRFTDERTGPGYFLAQVAVARSELERLSAADPRGQQLRPGLPAQVVIPTRTRTALQYLLEPLDQSIWTSFRES